MSIGTDLRSFITTDSTILTAFPQVANAGRCQLNKIDENTGLPRFWLQKSATNQELFYGGDTGLTITRFDFEVISIDIDEALSLAGTVKNALQGYSGTFGSTNVQLVEVDDHDSDYIAVNDSNEGYQIEALQISVYT
jgi:hypothetical protein